MDNHKRRIKMKGGAEYDALHRYSRGIYCYLTRSKTAKKIKRGYNKRFRRVGKEEANETE
jgi:hypothetical protein